MASFRRCMQLLAFGLAFALSAEVTYSQDQTPPAAGPEALAAAVANLTETLKSLKHDRPIELTFSNSEAQARRISCEGQCCDAVVEALQALGCGCACGADGGIACYCHF